MADYTDEQLRQILGFGSSSPFSSSSSKSLFKGAAPFYTAAFDPRSRDLTQGDRNFFDRLFAPFEAPQQTLFALTTGRSVWDSLSHGARYFNPFSNEQRIDPEEVRQTLFGDMAEGWQKTLANTTLSVLFDPLLVAPIAKGLGVGGRALKTIERISNPAQAAIDASRFAATEVLGPLAEQALKRIGGDAALSKSHDIVKAVVQSTFDRFYGVSDEAADAVRRAEGFKTSILGEGVRVVKTIQALNPQAREILAEAMETSAVWLNRTGQQITPVQLRAAQNLESKMLASGVHPDLFWQAYDRTQALVDNVGKYLVDNGALSSETFQQMRGSYLRRIYQATENPLVYADRLDALPVPIPAKVGMRNRDILENRLKTFRDDLYKSAGPMGPPTGVNPSPYFDRQGKFHAKNFTDDFDRFIQNNSDLSFAEIMDHVKTNMITGAGVGDKFYADIANYLSGSLHFTEGSAELAARLRTEGMRAIMGDKTPLFTFKPFSEHLDVISKRKDIGPEIRELLGEIIDPAPRVASYAKEVGGLASARQLFSELSGTKRLGTGHFEELQQASALGLQTQGGMDIINRIAKDLKINPAELTAELPRLLQEGAGATIYKRGTDSVSLVKDVAKGHTYQFKGEHYGDLNGMWTDVSTYLLLRGSDAVDTIRSLEGRAMNVMGELIKDGVGVFKYFKAVADPTGQARNFVGGAILANMAGLGFDAIKYIPRMIGEMRNWIQKGELGKYMQLAEDAGVNIWKQDLASVELRNLAYKDLDLAFDTGQNSIRVFSNALAGFDKIVSNAVRKVPGVGKMLDSTTGIAKSSIMDAVTHNFQYGDQFWKMGVFMHEYDRLASAAVRTGKQLTSGMSHEFARQAASLAQQSLFNYNDVPWLIRSVRSWGIIPFATFPFKAAPFVAKTLYDSPWRVLRYQRVIDGVNNLMVDSPATLAAEIDNLPDYMRDHMVIRVPFDDGLGRPQYLDMSYFMPWESFQMIPETAQYQGGFREGLFSTPLMAIPDMIRHNKDTNGRQIVRDSMSVGEKWEAVGHALGSFFFPSWMPGGTRATSFGKTLMAMATNSPERSNWSEILSGTGNVLADPFGATREALTGNPSLAKQAVTDTDIRVQHAEATMMQDGWASALLSAFPAAFGGTTATRGDSTRAERARGEMAREMASIRSNSKLSLSEKAKRIQAIREKYAARSK